VANAWHPGLSAAAPLDREAVELARPALAQLAAALHADDEISVRGVALTRLLLTEPSSALHAPDHREQLYEAARQALLALRDRSGSAP